MPPSWLLGVGNVIRNPAVNDGEAYKPLCSAEDDAKSGTRPPPLKADRAARSRETAAILREDVTCWLNLNCA